MNKLPSSKREAMLGMIGNLESNGNYNIMVGGKHVPLTGMTVGEVLDMQSGLKGDTAAGKYQIKESSLRSLVFKPGKEAGTYSKKLRNPSDFNLDTPFDEAAQDWAAGVLLDRRGFKDFEQGKMSDTELAHNLAKEWASLPDPKKEGQNVSHYGGDGKHDNPTRASVDDVFGILNVMEVKKPTIVEEQNVERRPIAPPVAGESSSRPSPIQGNRSR